MPLRVSHAAQESQPIRKDINIVECAKSLDKKDLDRKLGMGLALKEWPILISWYTSRALREMCAKQVSS